MMARISLEIFSKCHHLFMGCMAAVYQQVLNAALWGSIRVQPSEARIRLRNASLGTGWTGARDGTIHRDPAFVSRQWTRVK